MSTHAHNNLFCDQSRLRRRRGAALGRVSATSGAASRCSRRSKKSSPGRESSRRVLSQDQRQRDQVDSAARTVMVCIGEMRRCCGFRAICFATIAHRSKAAIPCPGVDRGTGCGCAACLTGTGSFRFPLSTDGEASAFSRDRNIKPGCAVERHCSLRTMPDTQDR